MKKALFISLFVVAFFSGCTQIITAPIKIVGATAGAVLDVAGSAVHAVTGGGNDKDK